MFDGDEASQPSTFPNSSATSLYYYFVFRPPDKVFADCTSIINTETRLTILGSYDINGRSPPARALVYYIV